MVLHGPLWSNMVCTIMTTLSQCSSILPPHPLWSFMVLYGPIWCARKFLGWLPWVVLGLRISRGLGGMRVKKFSSRLDLRLLLLDKFNNLCTSKHVGRAKIDNNVMMVNLQLITRNIIANSSKINRIFQIET